MIAEANPQTGLLMESLMATVAQSDKEAKRRIRAFLDHKTAKVKPGYMSAKPARPLPTASAAPSTHPLRAISFGDRRQCRAPRRRHHLSAPQAPLGDYPVRITDRLHHWAEREPDRVFMAERTRAAAGARSPMPSCSPRAGTSPQG